MGETRAVTVDRLRPGEIDAAARLLGESFVGESLFGWLFEGKDEAAVVRAVQPWFRGWLRSFVDQGEIHTARLRPPGRPGDVDGELVGAAIRTVPGGFPPTGLANVRFMARLIRGVLRMGLTSPRALQMPVIGDQITKREPDEPFWHLAWVGVSPRHQRRGVGSALADEIMGRIEAVPAPAWLVTFGPHTRRIYERRGFSVTEEFHPVPECPVCWSMRLDVSR